MGLRMDDIHTPSVPSGPLTNHNLSNVGHDRSSLIDLMSQKTLVESEMSALGSVLDSVSKATELQEMTVG